MNWSLSAEFTAFLIVFVVFLFAQRGPTPNKRSKLFVVSLAFAAISISLNILCTVLITDSVLIPHAIGLTLNSFYFLFSVFMSTALALYLMDIMLGRIHNAKWWRVILVLIAVVNVAYIALLIVNLTLAPGIIFSIDGDSNYQRGPLYQAGYFVTLSELALLFVGYWVNRTSIASYVVRTMHMMPPIIIALVGIQLLYPELLLNGTIFVTAMLVVYMNFQSIRVDTDSLTHVGTRACFYEDLAEWVKLKQPFQIIGVSPGDFSSINRRFGHQIGDEALYQVATWLEDYDLHGRAYRYGKVSFALMRPCESITDADNALHEVAERFDSPWEFDNKQIYLSVSCADIIRFEEQWTPDQVISYLDAAMEASKEQQLREMHFDSAFKQLIDRRIALVELLKRSIAHDRFRMCYQPIFNNEKHCFTHAEALIRLNDDNGNPVSPEEFIRLAERSGMMEDISSIVIDKVCKFLADNPQLPIETISINLSMPQLLDHKLPGYIASIAKRYGIEPSRLNIEVTERILSEDISVVAQSLERMNALGISCSLDDFGIGYSNMAAATKLPFARAKIDRSLLANVPVSEHACSIFTALVNLLHAMDFTIIAEGIETEEQAQFVASLGVEEMQGYYFARPLESDDFAPFLRRFC